MVLLLLTSRSAKSPFPTPCLGVAPPLFDAFYALNTTESDCYERLQQMIIDVLDTCCCVRVSGAAGNQTELSIRTRLPEHPEVQTAYHTSTVAAI